jgi:hypothetical protein
MRSTRVQLLVSLLAALVAAGFLIHRGPPPRGDFRWAVLQKDLASVTRCARWHVPPYDTGCETPMVDAVWWGAHERRCEIVEVLYVHGCLHERDRPLVLATLDGRLDILKMLISHGADVNGRQGRGYTPVHAAVAKENREIIRYLLDHGADINAAHDTLGTPLQFAKRFRIPSMVEYLQQHGATE